MPNTQKAINDICMHRGLPRIPRGSPCVVNGRSGQVWGGNHSANFNVKFDDNGQVGNCHPNWRMKITNDDGDVLHESENTRDEGPRAPGDISDE